MLGYKLEELGGQLVKVPPHHTSQICPCCNHQAKENRKTQSRFACENCGHTANADDVGAINILARGHRVLAVCVGVLIPFILCQKKKEISLVTYWLALLPWHFLFGILAGMLGKFASEVAIIFLKHMS